MLLDTAPSPPPHVLSVPSDLGFQNAWLGETLADWRRTAASGRRCQTNKTSASITLCATPAVDLGGGRIAHDITYEFVAGRLARIRFLTSIDAYNRVRARLDARFGPPAHIVRDSIRIDQEFETPHLTAYWRQGPCRIFLNDPERDGSSLSVTYTLAPLSSTMPDPST